jgi:hypothetical protein
VTTAPNAIDAAPAGFPGTLPEYLVYQALIKLGYDGRFEFQSSQYGGRVFKGGVVLDFYIPEESLAINIQGEYWHYAFPSRIAQDKIQRATLAVRGITLIWIDESDCLRNAVYFVREALRFVDHSKMMYV